MSKFYSELRDMWQSRVRNRYRRYWDERWWSVISHRANLSAERENCEMRRHWCTGPGWHKQSVAEGASEHNHDIFSVMQSDETRVWPPTRGRVMQTSWHPPTVSGGSQEASCKFIFMFLPQHRPAWPGYRSHACNVPRDPGLELRLMELLPGLEHSEFSAELH